VRQLFIDFNKAYDSVRREALYVILVKFGITMNLVRIIKMCLNEMCSRVAVGKHLCDVFPIRNGLKQGDALSPLLFTFTYVINGVRANQNGLKINDTYQHLVYGDDVNILGGSVNTLKKNTEVSIVASKKTGLEINADNTKYMFMSRDQNAGREVRR
jgi:hypothetical protein